MGDTASPQPEQKPANDAPVKAPEAPAGAGAATAAPAPAPAAAAAGPGSVGERHLQAKAAPDAPQVGAEDVACFEREGEREVGVEASLVVFVEDHDADAVER